MTVSFSVWSVIGWTIEILLIFFAIILWRAFLRIKATLKSTTENLQSVARAAPREVRPGDEFRREK